MGKSLISMLEIADVICEDVGDVTKRYRTSILRHLATCYRKLQIFVNNETDIATFVSPAANVIHMPSDFMYETKVGVKHGDKVVLIEKNYEQEGTGLMNVTQTGALNYVKSIVFNNSYHDHCTPMYNSKGEILYAYGPGIKCDGLYSIDRNKGIIEIGSAFPEGCEIVVEYVSDGVSQGQKMVPIEMYDCLYNYGAWKFFFQRMDSRWRQSAQDYDESYYQVEMLYKFVPINYIVKLFNQETHTINDRM